MIYRHQLVLALLLSLSFSVNAELSKKEKVATAAVLAENKTKAISKNTGTRNENKTNQPRLASIDVSGVDSELKKNIELHMPVSIPECDADRGDIKHFFNTVKKHLRKASRALGYYDSSFRSGGSVVDGCWKLRLRITPGKPTKIISQKISIVGEGRNDPLFKKILEKLPYKKGDVLNHKHYSDFKTQLKEAAESLGYFDAEFEKHSIQVDPLRFQAKVALILNTGKRYRYGTVTVDQKILSDVAIKKYLIIKTGEPYDTEDLINQQQLLQRSGFYKLIKVEVLHQQAKNFQVPIAITLTSKKRNSYKFKVGYGSDTGGRISAEMDRRWTGSKGKQLKIKAQYAQTLSVLSLQLVSPRENPEDNSLVYNIDFKKDSNDDVVSRSINIGGKFTRKLESDWIQSVSIGALIDRTQVEGEEEVQSELLVFGVGLEKVKADNLIYPTNGWRLKFGLSLAAKALLSDQDVLQFRAFGKRVNKFGEGRLFSRFELGSTLVEDEDRLPKSLRFFTGGGTSVRGYSFESLSEENSLGKAKGARNLLVLSLEYQHPITEQWGAAAFVDTGNAFNDWGDYDLKVGVGLGARWRSPVGPVRIDIGFPKDDFKSPQLHLSIGSDL
ncbi:MAG: autotransporter assembly complex family protein [Cocleimonas sp.]